MACWRGVCRRCRGLSDDEEEAPIQLGSLSECTERAAHDIQAQVDTKTHEHEAKAKTKTIGMAATVRPSILIEPKDSASSVEAGSGEGSIQQYYNLDSEDIGMGVSCRVCLATSRSTGLRRAVKVLNKQFMSEAMQNEIVLVKSMAHPNIIKFFETFEDSCNVFIVMELCGGGGIFDEIASAGQLNEKDAAMMVGQVCAGVSYIHSQGICHRDLKPDHLICEAKGTVNSLKIVDFGLSRRFHRDEVMRTAVGTALYAAPEVIMQSYGPLCDLWSCGVIFYCLLCGCLPFDGETPKQVVKKVKKAQYSLEGHLWEPVSDSAKDLISKLLVKDPRERLSAAQVMEHEWVRDHAPGSRSSLGQSVVKNLQAFVEEAKWARSMLENRADPTQTPSHPYGSEKCM